MYGFLAVVNGKACFYEEKKNVFKVCNDIKTKKPKNPKMKSYGLCNFVESLFSHVVLIFRETLFTCFTWNDMMPSISKNQGVFKINVFSHCFPIKRKSSYDFVVTA